MNQLLGVPAPAAALKRVAVISGVVATTYALAGLAEVMDGRLHRSGVRRPRALMAAAGAGLALGASFLDQQRSAENEAGDTHYPRERELPDRVRAIVAAILEQTEDHDSLRLRAQLLVAKERVWGDVELGRMLELAVPYDVPLAVPHSFTFPVSAQFLSPRGIPCSIHLLVNDGRLACLLADVGQEEGHVPAGQWPRVQDLTFVTEVAGRP